MSGPHYDDKYHPHRIQYAGSTPRGWSDEYRYVPYVREDLHQSALRAEREKALREAAEAWEAFKAATTTDAHFAAVDRLDALFALIPKDGEKP